MTYRIVDLKNVPDEVDRFGGKAVILSKLLKHGLSVPEGFVVSSEYYEDYILNGLNLNEFSNEINIWLDKNGMTNECIVRSSANVESIKECDCPGIFESFVCQERSNIVLAIKQVWESTNAYLAQSFFHNMNNSNQPRMAVIVQHIKRGQYNLVIQSHDVIYDKDRAIVEYCEGELNSIVDDVHNASLCYINYSNEESVVYPFDLPIELIRNDCKLIESIIGGKAEIEAQLENGKIWYLQARVI